jgi:hypothetical protein
MLFRTFVRAMASVLCLSQCLIGCGSLGENTPDRLDFDLPLLTPTFAVPSANQRWPPMPPGGIPDLVCAGPEALTTNCCSPPAPAQAIDCQIYPLSCDSSDNTCAMVFDFEQSADVDLTKVREVAAVAGRIFSSVSLVSLTTVVTDKNELPVLRTASLFVAPEDATSSTTPGAAYLAPVDLLAPGAQVVVPDALAQAAFSGYATNYETPFSILLSAHMVLKHNSATTGAVGFTVAARSEARY